jgi:hypothetical protein
MKTCTGCKETKPLSEYQHDPRYADRLKPRCRPCLNRYQKEYVARNRDKVLAQKRANRWRPENLEKDRARQREAALKRMYGITAEERDALLEAQGGVCAICGALDEFRAMNVDHDHETGLVRGILCAGCNLGLGNFKDSLDKLKAAVAYLEGRSHRE